MTHIRNTFSRTFCGIKITSDVRRLSKEDGMRHVAAMQNPNVRTVGHRDTCPACVDMILQLDADRFDAVLAERFR